MMLRLSYSNRTEPLVAALARDLAAERERRGVLDPHVVLMPNAVVERWVQLELARQTGIAANLRFGSLDAFLGDVARASRPEVSVLDGTPLVGALLSALSSLSSLSSSTASAPVADYLGTDSDDRSVRLVQLAHKLASVYRRYAEEQPERLAGFRRGVSDRPSDGDLAWQGPLWNEVSRRGELALPLLLGLAPSQLVLPPAVHLVLPSLLPRSMQLLLRRVGLATRLYVYALNPCREFWEDVQHGRPPRLGEVALEEPDPFGLFIDHDGDQPALRAWGRPARERIRLFNELSECDFVPSFVEPAGDGVLPSLQRDILARASSPGGAVDDSLRLVRAPSVRRELETLAADVWRQIGNGVLPWHIGIAVPEASRDQYQTLLPSVFAEAHQLPFTLASTPLARSSSVPGCLERLWSLPLSTLSRHEVLAVMMHRLVRARLAEPSEADAWPSLAERVGIFFGADRADHAGSYAALRHDVLSWDQGLRRVGIGGYLAGRRSGQDSLFWTGGEPYLAEEAASASFALLGRSLVADARRLGSSLAPLDEQLRRMRVLATTYIAAVSDDDRRAFDRCIGALDSLHDLGWGDAVVSWRAAWELVRRALAGLRGPSSRLLTDGVVVGSIGELSGVPFQALYLVGMTETAFPASDEPDPLLARPAQRRAGDLGVRDRDRDRFLEALVGTDRLWISWVDRQPTTGDVREPSSVVSELLQMLSRSQVDHTLLTTVVPALRSRDAAACAVLPEAAAEARAVALGESLRAHLGRPLGWDEVPQLPSQLSAALGLQMSVVGPAAGRESRERTVSLSDLRRFLECPLQSSVRFVGLREDREDPSLRTTERFAAQRGMEAQFLADVFLRARSHDPFSLAAAWDDAALRAELDGVFPTGPFFDVMRKRHLSTLDAWGRLLGREAGGMRPRVVQMGPGEEHARVDLDLMLPAVRLIATTSDGKETPVAIVGRTQPLLFTGHPLGDGARSLLLSERDRDATRQKKKLIRGFLDGVVLAAAGSVENHGVVELVAAEGRVRSVALGSFEPAAARAYLAMLSGHLLDGVHGYLLPCEAVFKWWGQAGSLTDAIRKEREGGRSSSVYGPAPHPERFPVPAEEWAVEQARARFEPFLSRLDALADDDDGDGESS